MGFRLMRSLVCPAESKRRLIGDPHPGLLPPIRKVAPLTPNQATNYPLINDGADVHFQGKDLPKVLRPTINTKVEVNAMYWNPYEGSPKIFKKSYPTTIK